VIRGYICRNSRLINISILAGFCVLLCRRRNKKVARSGQIASSLVAVIILSEEEGEEGIRFGCCTAQRQQERRPLDLRRLLGDGVKHESTHYQTVSKPCCTVQRGRRYKFVKKMVLLFILKKYKENIKNRKKFINMFFYL
jgi:hypothetical protein